MGRGGVDRVLHSAKVCMTCFNKMAPIIVKGMLGLCFLMDCEVVKTCICLDIFLIILIIIKIIKHTMTAQITYSRKTMDAIYVCLIHP